jgi:hypothetical protein
MSVTTKIGGLILGFYTINPFEGSPLLYQEYNSAVNQLTSDDNADAITGFRTPSAGANLLVGNGGSDVLRSNSTQLSWLIGSSDTTTGNREIDILIGASAGSDNFVLHNRYRGSGYAIIKSFDKTRDALFVDRGVGGDSIKYNNGAKSFSTGLVFQMRTYESQASTYLFRQNGDLVAILQGVQVNAQTLFDYGALNFSASVVYG